MAKAEDDVSTLSDIETILVYHFLDRIKGDANFRSAVLRDPELAFACTIPQIPYSKLLSPSLLEVMGKLRRVALEEIGIDVAPYRNDMSDNGFKLIRDNKK